MSIPKKIKKLEGLSVPSITSITGRSSAIRAAFVKAIIPEIFPENEKERDAILKQSLGILKHTKKAKHCAYCLATATEWDHFRPIIENSKPSGYCTDLYNLVPACGKCNQSKGSSNWEKWIESDAPLSPKSKNTKNLPEIIENLKAFESWSKPLVHELNKNEKEELESYMEECKNYILQLANYQIKATGFKSKFEKNAFDRISAKRISIE